MKPYSLFAALAALIVAYPISAETLKVAVESAEAGPDPFMNQPVVTIKLKPESKMAFGEFTRAHIGEQVKIRLGQTVLSEPWIREPILEGAVVINAQFTVETARELAAAIMKADASFEVDGSDK